jgi:hypothetical protein
MINTYIAKTPRSSEPGEGEAGRKQENLMDTYRTLSVEFLRQHVQLVLKV